MSNMNDDLIDYLFRRVKKLEKIIDSAPNINPPILYDPKVLHSKISVVTVQFKGEIYGSYITSVTPGKGGLIVEVTVL